METRKNFVINCAACDLRNISKAILDAYEKIEINSAMIYSTPSANELVAGYDVTMNCAEVLTIPENTELKVINGRTQITGNDTFKEPVCLLVNGKVEIAPDAAMNLRQIVKLIVNGKLLYPSTLKGCLPPVQVNGRTICYPADSIRMKPDGIIDKIFVLRAKAAKYFAERRVMLLDSSLNIARLIEKKTEFITPKAYIATSLLEEGVTLFDEETDIVEVPDGCRYIEGDVLLSDSLIARNGTRLIVSGDVQIDTQNAADLLDKLEYLCVLGEMEISDKLVYKLSAPRFAINCIQIVKGKKIVCKESCIIDNELLRQNDGITVINCEKVYIDSSVKNEEIIQKVMILNCGTVMCAPQQKSSVLLVADNVEKVVCKEEAQRELSDENTNTINTATYTF